MYKNLIGPSAMMSAAPMRGKAAGGHAADFPLGSGLWSPA
ncbi:MAG: hypothetical protein JWR60_2096 [Polaromonas sp.]|nr:hypothetical protein [Polaromonas sp.]